MARMRTIKHGFFTNDVLAEVEPLGRLLFAGLWCIADREGRLEDRPRKIKAEVLPYDNCDIDELLDALAGRGFICRYAVDGARYIAIVNFGKHQTPHMKEASSTIPAPDKHSARTVLAPDQHQQDVIPAPPVMGSSNGIQSVGNNSSPGDYDLVSFAVASDDADGGWANGNGHASTLPDVHPAETPTADVTSNITPLRAHLGIGAVNGAQSSELPSPFQVAPAPPAPKRSPVTNASSATRTEGTAAVAPPARARRPLWDALVEEFGFAPTTEHEKKRRGKVVHDLNAVQATAHDVHERCANHALQVREGIIQWTLTANALVTHWSELSNEATQAAIAKHRAMLPRARAAPPPTPPRRLRTAASVKPVGWD